MRVLLIEDDGATAQSIELMLKSESFNVYTTDLGEEGVDLGKLYDYDIILLDLNLPDMSGYEVLRTLRVSKVKTPILILSGMAGIEDKVKGLGFGADDYLTKPFHKDELVARIHAIVRRSKGHAQSVIQTGDLVVNLDTKTVEVNGQRVHLTGKEYQMLELLSLRKGTTLTRRCSSIISTAAWTSRSSRSSTCSSASCARSSPTRPAARTTSRRSGAAATCCASRSKTRRASRPDISELSPSLTARPPDSDDLPNPAPSRAGFLFLRCSLKERPESCTQADRALSVGMPQPCAASGKYLLLLTFVRARRIVAAFSLRSCATHQGEPQKGHRPREEIRGSAIPNV
jgi:two-component system cell cycle response regulator CtrA